jgi:hypothetical protein
MGLLLVLIVEIAPQSMVHNGIRIWLGGVAAIFAVMYYLRAKVWKKA